MTGPPAEEAPRPSTPLVLRDQVFDTARPAVMAIVNRTPDSFYSGARHDDMQAALDAVDRAIREGADIIDVGGVRAGAEGARVDAEQEIERVQPFLVEVRRRHPKVVLSLDTWRSEVASACGDAGIDLVNDTWAGHDERLLTVASRLGAGIVCSHTGGLPPRTDPVNITYGDDGLDVVTDVMRGLRAEAERARGAGIPDERILLDPTLDFGKTTQHSLTVLRHSAEVVALGLPVMQAISRKDFIGESLGLDADQRLNGTLAATAVAAWQGVTVFRAHDVRATREVLDMVACIRGDRPPAHATRGVPAAGARAVRLRHPRG